MASKKFPQYIAGLSATGGALALGTMLGWTSPAQKQVMNGDFGFPVDGYQYSWVGSILNLGAAVVCIPIGMLCNVIGRKWSIMVLALPCVIGWCLLIWSQNLIMMYIGRFILGVGGAGFCVVAPMYNSEIAEKDNRGAIGSFFQLMVTVGILLVYCLGAGLDVFLLSIVCLAIPIISAIIFIFMPESPTYLISKDKPEKAAKSIEWLRGKDYNASAEIEELTATNIAAKANPVPFWAALKRKITLKALSIVLVLMMLQQLSGINAVIFYSTDIFMSAKAGMDAVFVTILIGTIQVVATLFSATVVDKVGRRILLLASAAFMALSTACIGIFFYIQANDADSAENLGWLAVCGVCLFIIMSSIGFGPIPWILMSELFANDVKSVAVSIAGTTNWLLVFVVTKSFVNLKTAIGTGPAFWLYSIIEFLGVIYIIFFVPETKGKSLNEIQALLGGKKSDDESPKEDKKEEQKKKG